MKPLIAVIVLSLISQLAVAQKDFEGVVTYSYPAFMDSKTDTQVVYFGKQKIKVDNKIYDFKSGYVYTVYSDDSSYIKEPIKDLVAKRKNIEEVFTGKRKSISGFVCSCYEEKRGMNNKAWSNVKKLVWYTDSLYYFIPKKFENCASLLEFVKHGKIIAERTATSIIDNLPAFKITTLIVKQPVSDSVFQLPKGSVMEIRNLPFKSQGNKKGEKSRRWIGGT